MKIEWEFKQTLQKGSSCELHIFQKHSGVFKVTAQVVKTGWGVDVNSAFCKNRLKVETNPTFLEDTEGEFV